MKPYICYCNIRDFVCCTFTRNRFRASPQNIIMNSKNLLLCGLVILLAHLTVNRCQLTTDIRSSTSFTTRMVGNATSVSNDTSTMIVISITPMLMPTTTLSTIAPNLVNMMIVVSITPTLQPTTMVSTINPNSISTMIIVSITPQNPTTTSPSSGNIAIFIDCDGRYCITLFYRIGIRYTLSFRFTLISDANNLFEGSITDQIVLESIAVMVHTADVHLYESV